MRPLERSGDSGPAIAAIRSALESIARQTLSADTTPDEDALAGLELIDEIARRYLENEPP